MCWSLTCKCTCKHWPQSELLLTVAQSCPYQCWLLWRVQWQTTVSSDLPPTVRETVITFCVNAHTATAGILSTCTWIIHEHETYIPELKHVCFVYSKLSHFSLQRRWQSCPIIHIHLHMPPLCLIWRYTTLDIPTVVFSYTWSKREITCFTSGYFIAILRMHVVMHNT